MFAPNFAESLAAQWNRGPRLFRNALLTPLFDGADFMTVMQGAAKEYIADPDARVPPARVFLKSEIAPPAQRPHFLPRGAAETCEQYVARLVRTFPNDPVGIVVDNCEKFVPAMRDALVPVLHRLFATASYPARRNHLCIYAGNYRSTPFGIHRDECHVVMLCGVGRKSMAFWPREYFDSRKELFVGGKLRARVQEHLADATVLEIGPLDALYWSSDDWHVAVSETDEFQAALSVGIYHHGTSAELISALDFVASSTRPPGYLDVEGLPVPANGTLSIETLRGTQMSGFFERWEQLRAGVSAAGEDDYRALDFALRLMSSAGYGRLRTAPPEAPADVAGRMLRCAIPESLVVSRVRGGVMVGANGSAFFYDRAVAEVESVVLLLRDGTPRLFSAVVAGVEASAADTVTTLLRDLVGSTAVSAMPA